jgi:Protein of unknown function (DUF2752)
MEPTHLSGSSRVLCIVVGSSLASGVVGLGISRIVDFSCPFRGIGLACPGCGCTRVVTGFLQGDFEKTLSAQPTATVLLAFLGLAMIWITFSHLVSKRWEHGWERLTFIPLGLVLLAGFVNWIFQLVMV